MSSIQEQPQVPAADIPAADTTGPQIPKQESASQSVAQPETTEPKDHAVSSGNVEESANAGSSESAESAEKTMDQGRRGTAAIMEDHHVSREALKGPTGEAKRTAAEFEQEKKTGKPAGGSVSEGGAADAKEGEKSKSKSSGDSKPSTMEKLKEKIAHPLHGKKSD